MNFASTPNWAWIALAVAGGLYLYRNGWLDNLLKRLPAPQAPSLPQQPTSPQVITFKHVIEPSTTPSIQAAEPPSTDLKPPTGQPVIERLTVRGPLKINVSEGGIDVFA